MASAGMITAGAPSGRPADILAHERPQIRIGRLHAKPEEAQAAQQQYDDR